MAVLTDAAMATATISVTEPETTRWLTRGPWKMAVFAAGLLASWRIALALLLLGIAWAVFALSSEREA